jgi:cardiolipin synthase (CMP-forming)
VDAEGGADAPDRIFTVPNGISVLRLAGIPLFLWLLLGPRADVWAVVVLVASGLSDWVDGKIARAWNQQSRLGQMLDPAADRLYVAATVIALAIRAIIPWWLLGVLAARELAVGVALALLRRRGYGALQVSFAGKSATLCLLYAFPLLLLGAHTGTWALVARVIGWAFVVWGTALYWWSAGLYLTQARQLLRASPGRAGGLEDRQEGPGHEQGRGPRTEPDRELERGPGPEPDQPAKLDEPVWGPETGRESRQP